MFFNLSGWSVKTSSPLEWVEVFLHYIWVNLGTVHLLPERYNTAFVFTLLMVLELWSWVQKWQSEKKTISLGIKKPISDLVMLPTSGLVGPLDHNWISEFWFLNWDITHHSCYIASAKWCCANLKSMHMHQANILIELYKCKHQY